MTESCGDPTVVEHAPATRRPRVSPRITIRTLLLLIAAAAPWLAYYSGRLAIERHRGVIEVLRQVEPELYPRGGDEYACLKVERNDGLPEFHCHLPPGSRYRLALICDGEYFIYRTLVPEHTVALEAGEHWILLDEGTQRLTVAVDGVVELDVPRRKAELIAGIATGVSDQFDQQWHRVDEPLYLLLRYDWLPKRRGGQQTDRGIALWIDRLE